MALSLRPRCSTLASLAVSTCPRTPSLLALGWATVELDRATASWRSRPALERRPVRTAPDDEPWAPSLVASTSADGALLVLEPRTEGRLAAALARHGEGPVAAYLAAPSRLTALLTPVPSDPDPLLPPLGDPARRPQPARPACARVGSVRPLPSAHDDGSDHPPRHRRRRRGDRHALHGRGLSGRAERHPRAPLALRLDLLDRPRGRARRRRGRLRGRPRHAALRAR